MLAYDIPSQQFCNAQEPDTDDPKAFMCRMVDAHGAYLRNKVLAGTSPYEAASWPLKVAQALQYTADQKASVPILEAEALFRGVTPADIATRVLRNAQALGGLEAALSGVAGRHRDAIKALDSNVTEYDWRGGWPEV